MAPTVHGGSRPALREVEARVLDAIDMEGLIAGLQELIAIPTFGGQEREGQEHVASAMKGMGLEVDRWEIDLEAIRRHPQFSMEIEREGGLGVVGVLGDGAGGRGLILNGHIDVVPPGDEGRWTSSPWEGALRDDRVYGRGAADMKGGLCCSIFAAKAIRDAGVRLKGRLMVQSVIGEEDGGVGTLAAALRGYRADGAIILEPTEMRIAPAQAGALSFRVRVPGLGAHAAVRTEGVSAVEKFVVLQRGLRRLEADRNRELHHPLFKRYRLPYAISIGTIKGGTWPSSVPEEVVFEGRYGVAVGEGPGRARRAFEAAVAEASRRDPWLRDHQPTVEWWGGQFEPASIPVDHPLVTTVSEGCRTVTGLKPTIEGVPYGSDMRLMVKVAGTPTVLFGPGDVRRAHGPNEFVHVRDLEVAVKSIALTVLRFCGQEGDGPRRVNPHGATPGMPPGPWTRVLF